jgi:hypothetical protein
VHHEINVRAGTLAGNALGVGGSAGDLTRNSVTNRSRKNGLAADRIWNGSNVTVNSITMIGAVQGKIIPLWGQTALVHHIHLEVAVAGRSRAFIGRLRQRRE